MIPTKATCDRNSAPGCNVSAREPYQDRGELTQRSDPENPVHVPRHNQPRRRRCARESAIGGMAGGECGRGREGEGSPRLEPPCVKSLGEVTKESVVQSRSRLWSVHSMVNAHRLCWPDYHPGFYTSAHSIYRDPGSQTPAR